MNSPSLDGKRILVYGVTGAGKTTFARQLSEKTGIPWHSVDDLTWLPNWVQLSVEDQRKVIKAICDGPEWILDTAYGVWTDLPLERAEVIIALDYPRWRSFLRLTCRTFTRLFDRRTICNGNRESLRMMFSKQSILLWHCTSFSSKRARIRKWLSEGELRVIAFRHPRQAKVWLRQLKP